MRIARISLSVFFFALVASTGLPAAEADDYGCDGYGGSVYTSRGAVHRHHHGRTQSCRDPYHPSTRYVLPRYHGAHRGCSYGRGTPWSVLRRGLRGLGTHEYRRWYVGQYFYRRFPFAAAEAEEARIDALLAQAEEAGEDGEPLPPEARLRRAMARFFVADYQGAGVDFDAVLAASPKNVRARFGHLFTAVFSSDWKTAARDLNTLAAAGELKGGDRVVADGSFSDPKVFDAVVAGLVGDAKYRITDGDAHLVAAWALSTSGKLQKARTYARLARRWKSSNPALPALEKNLGIARKKAVPAKSVPPTEESPIPAPRGAGEVPPRTVADAKKIGS